MAGGLAGLSARRCFPKVAGTHRAPGRRVRACAKVLQKTGCTTGSRTVPLPNSTSQAPTNTATQETDCTAGRLPRAHSGRKGTPPDVLDRLQGADGRATLAAHRGFPQSLRRPRFINADFDIIEKLKSLHYKQILSRLLASL